MALSLEERMKKLVDELNQRPGLADQLPSPQRDVVLAALQGQDVHQIASHQNLDEGAVWQFLDDAARWAIGKPPARGPEQGGLGSDTDPGVTGGYGDTAFGSIGNEPPTPTPEEPKENQPRKRAETHKRRK